MCSRLFFPFVVTENFILYFDMKCNNKDVVKNLNLSLEKVAAKIPLPPNCIFAKFSFQPIPILPNSVKLSKIP